MREESKEQEPKISSLHHLSFNHVRTEAFSADFFVEDTQRNYRGGTSEVSIFFVVPISRQRGGGGCQLAVVCVSPRPPAWLRLLLLLSFDV